MSCLMHLDGLIRRQKMPIRIVHIAEILDVAMTAGTKSPARDVAVELGGR
jgi:L-lactate dehydrogenase complex protein LldE